MHPGSRARVVVAVLAALLAIPFAPVVPARAAELPTVTVTSSDAATIYGDPVTFAASVSGTAGEATGTIQFAVNETDLGDPVTLTGGSASSDAITTLEVGTYAITAHFSSADTGVYESADGTLVGGQEIARAELTVEPDPKTVAYGSAAPAYTFQVNGFVLGESAATADGYVASSCSSDYTSSTPVASSPRTIACSGGSADNYQFNYETAALTISKADQTITFSQPPDRAFDESPVTISASADSGLAVTFSSLSTGVCTVAGTTVTFPATGDCTIRAAQGGNSNFHAAPNVDRTFAVDNADQTITFAPLTNQTFDAGSITVSATATSGLPVTFTSQTPSTCTTGGTQGVTVTFVTVGPCEIRASQAGDADWNAATPVDRSFTISKGSQIINFSSTPPTAVVGGPTYTPVATATSGLTVTFTIDATAADVCTFGAGVVSFIDAGTCVVNANQGGNTNWNAASQVQQSFSVGGGTSTTVVASNHNPSVFGQAVTFSATVSGGGATPTGTVTFRDGATTLGSGTLNGSGVATLTTSALSVATYSITATYGGSASYGASTSSTLSQVVGKAGTTLGLASSDASSVYGQAVTFRATISVTAPGGGSASGTVQFRVDGLDVGAPVTLAGGQATLATSALGAGSHEITAFFAGEGSYQDSFGTLAGGQTVAKKTLTVTAEDASREYGQANPPYTATITGFVNGETLATSGVSGSPACSSAATETSPVSGSPYPITCAAGSLAAANYTFAFAAGDLTVAAATSTVTLVSSINPAVPSQPVTLTATVTGPVTGLPAPGGSIAFQARSGATWTTFDSQALTAAFSASTAVIVSSTEGTYDYRVVFTSPDGNYANGTGELVQSVGKSPVTVEITPSRPAWETNVPLTFAATISPEATGATVPVTGTVDFTVDGGATQAVAVANGVASLPAGALALGDHTITAAYSGDASFLGGTATPLTGTVVPNVVDATGVGVSGSSIYPVKDTWRDTVAIRGTRNEPLGVTIRIYSPTGRLILTKTITTGTGAYSYSWNGRYSSGTIRPAGKYKVVQTHTDRSSAPALTKTWTSYVTLSTRRMYWTTVSLYKNANAPSMWSGSPSLLTSSRYANGARMITPSSVSGWAAFGYQFTLPSATTITKVAFYVQGGPWSGANAPKVGLNDWRASATYGTCSSTSWCQAYSPTRVRRAVGTSTTSWYGISGDPAAVVRTVSGKRYVRGFVDTGGWFAGFRYEFARVRLVVTYGVLR